MPPRAGNAVQHGGPGPRAPPARGRRRCAQSKHAVSSVRLVLRAAGGADSFLAILFRPRDTPFYTRIRNTVFRLGHRLGGFTLLDSFSYVLFCASDVHGKILHTFLHGVCCRVPEGGPAVRPARVPRAHKTACGSRRASPGDHVGAQASWGEEAVYAQPVGS